MVFVETTVKSASGLGLMVKLHQTKMQIADARQKVLNHQSPHGSMAHLALPFTMAYAETIALSATGLGQQAQTGKTQMLIVGAK